MVHWLDVELKTRNSLGTSDQDMTKPPLVKDKGQGPSRYWIRQQVFEAEFWKGKHIF